MNGVEIFGLIEQIAATSKTTEKLKLLKTGFADETFRTVMKYAYSINYNYGIGYVEKANEAGARDITEAFNILNGLIMKRYTGNQARELIYCTLNSLDAPSQELFRRILHKDMRAGFSLTSLNKVQPKFLEEPIYMRCSLPDGVKLETFEWERGVFVQLKADGAFCSATKNDNDTLTFMSRSGEVWTGPKFQQLEYDCSRLLIPFERLDGELLVYRDGKMLDRKTGNGILNSIRQGANPEGVEVRFFVWDLVHLAKLGQRDYQGRFESLKDRIAVSSPASVEMIETHVVHDYAKAQKIAAGFICKGLEGAIIKCPSGLYKDGTSKKQVKIKVEFEVEVEVTGFVEGSKGTKTEKTFGALTFKSKDGLVIGSTSGFTDEMRESINNNRDDWIGAIITVRANDLTRAKNSDTWALSHPRFIERRTDKTEADDLAKIQLTLNSVLKGN